MSLPTCAHCNTAATDLKKCSRCKCTFYCNAACQKAHWKLHKAICSTTGIIALQFTVDRSVRRAYPTFPEYKAHCDRTGEKLILVKECFTAYREPDGHVFVVVDEEKWQNHLRKVEEKIANAANSPEPSLKDEVVGVCEDQILRRN
jgi:hypothetical protein